MRLCTITPGLTGQTELRLYEIEPHTSLRPRPSGAASPSTTRCGEVAPQSATQSALQPIKSSAVTRPFVSARILRMRAAEGVRSPLKYRLTDATDTPSASARSVCDMPSAERNSASVMLKHYHVGNASQEPATYSVAALSRYLRGMARKAKELKKFRLETGLSQKRFGALFGYSDAQVNRWENGKEGLPDDAAIDVADALTLYLRRPITPFQVKPEFNHIQLARLEPHDRDHHLESVERSYEKRAQKLIKDSAASATPDAMPAEEKRRG